MNRADKLVDLLLSNGVECVFCLTGGQAMYINDALARNKRIKTIFFHHEQSCVMAADAYARANNRFGVVVVTSGPGSTNTLTGVAGAYLDSAAVMIVSGQTNSRSLDFQKKTGIRQYGVQGINLENTIKPLVKQYYLLSEDVSLELIVAKAIKELTSPRRGPVWLDFPLDVQNMDFTEKEETTQDDLQISEKSIEVKETLTRLFKESRRPLIIAGQGITLGNVRKEFHDLVNTFSIPVVTSRLGIDLIESNNPLFVGRPGTYGDRAGNIIVQKCDLLIVLGSRLSTSTIGYNEDNFGKNSKKIIVDVDNKELLKHFSNIELLIEIKLEDFVPYLYDLLFELDYKSEKKWLAYCAWLKNRYLTELNREMKNDADAIDLYFFMNRLSHFVSSNSLILVDTGSVFHVAAQTWKIKKGQRYITTGGLSPMGYWVAGIGLGLVPNYDQVIIITGDGSFQMNIQELAVVRQLNLPLKIFVINNGGYLLIRNTQKNYMNDRMFGESVSSGLWFPKLSNIAISYEMNYIGINRYSDIDESISTALKSTEPIVVEVLTDSNQELVPRIASRRSPDESLVPIDIENMYPFLDEKELLLIEKMLDVVDE